jgi:uncharacterized protein YbaP (TraB family)
VARAAARVLGLGAALLALAASAAAAEQGALASSGSVLHARADTLASAAPSSTANPAQRHGALYRVSRAGEVGYLFGTVHVGRPDFYPLPVEVTRALTASRTLVVELDTRSDAAFQRALARHGLYAAGDSVSRHVSADTLARLKAALQARGYQFDNVDHLKPWLLANVLAGAVLERAGYHRSEGLEFFLLGRAQAQGSQVAELESAELQLALFDSMDERASEDYLRETLADLEDGSALGKSRELIDAWYSGDEARQESAWRSATTGDSVASAFTRKVLLGQRNPDMADGIERILEQGGTSFVGVGLLHLLGDDGLPRLLAQRGYTVERMY